MKKLMMMILILFCVFSMAGQQDKWLGKWVVSYHAYFNDGWIFKEIEFSENGHIYMFIDGRKKVAGEWIIEEIISKGSPLVFRLLKFGIWENEFVILYNDVKSIHIGRALVSDRKSNWAMNPVSFEMKKMKTEN